MLFGCSADSDCRMSKALGIWPCPPAHLPSLMSHVLCLSLYGSPTQKPLCFSPLLLHCWCLYSSFTQQLWYGFWTQGKLLLPITFSHPVSDIPVLFLPALTTFCRCVQTRSSLRACFCSSVFCSAVRW